MIKYSQGLDQLAALDPDVEYRIRLASAFELHYSRLAEDASRRVFLSLHADTSPQWVKVQRSRARTPAEEASERETEEAVA